MIRQNIRNENFKKFAEMKGFSYESVYYPDAAALYDGLQSGEVDAAVTTSLRAVKNEWMLDIFFPGTILCYGTQRRYKAFAVGGSGHRGYGSGRTGMENAAFQSIL